LCVRVYWFCLLFLELFHQCGILLFCHFIYSDNIIIHHEASFIGPNLHSYWNYAVMQFFFLEFNIRLYDKNSYSNYFFFPPPKSDYFFRVYWFCLLFLELFHQCGILLFCHFIYSDNIIIHHELSRFTFQWYKVAGLYNESFCRSI
jgi:hypothetical protein